MRSYVINVANSGMDKSLTIVASDKREALQIIRRSAYKDKLKIIKNLGPTNQRVPENYVEEQSRLLDLYISRKELFIQEESKNA